MPPRSAVQHVALPEAKVRAVQAAVQAWYRGGHRDLPWRRTHDPYAILVSEVMLQQTQVDRVLPKYLDWLERYPTLEALAAAPRAEVIRNWAPLGYNMRAVRLHEIARQAVERFGGRLPDTVEGLLALKGIGPYTAAAVATFAFGQAEPVMDTNVRRVLGRIFASEVPGATEDDRLAWALARAALPGGGADDVYDWNQALMDVGATVCLARNPRCPVCPAQAECAARGLWFAPGAVQLGLGEEPHPRPLSQGERGVWEDGPRGQRGSERLVAEARVEYRPAVQGGRSKGKRQEERFEGSRRWWRGRIVDALRELPPGAALTVREIEERVKPGLGAEGGAWLEELVAALARDGLVEVDGGVIRLPS